MVTEAHEVVSRRWMVREEELDDEQYRIRTLRPDNYLVQGCAGSGKTVLALHKAKEIQDSAAGTYLVVIYTITLQDFIKDGITSLGLDPDRICLFDRLDKLGYEEADFIIVDEVQDFPLPVIQRLVGMARKHFLFFGDDAQQLYEKGTRLNQIQSQSNIADSNFKRLERNYRLPVQIARYAAHVASHADRLVERCVKQEGEKPLVLKCRSAGAEIDHVISLIQSEGWTDVGILCDTNDRVQQLKEMFTKRGLPVESKYNTGNRAHDDLNFYTEKPKILTFHSSKGLQFENVILPMCDVSGNNYRMKDALYVALARASMNLVITFSSQLSPHLASIPRDLYDYREL